MKNKIIYLFALLSLTSYALEVNIINLKTKENLGTIEITENKYGTIFTPKLKKLPPGLHGIHIHENGNINSITKNGKEVLGGAAGSHYDPYKTKKHGYSWDDSAHKGDLPALYVDKKGNATTAIFSPRLNLKEINGRSIIIHAHGDNHSDSPSPLGGGGSRLSGGLIPK